MVRSCRLLCSFAAVVIECSPCIFPDFLNRLSMEMTAVHCTHHHARDCIVDGKLHEL